METNQASILIAQALEDYYFKGIYEGNINTLGNILNPGTLLFGDVKGEPYAKTLDQYFDGVANRQSPKDSGKPFKGAIISINVVNSIAIAKVHVKMYDFNYDEFLSFHKINNEWMIVNKMIADTAGQLTGKESGKKPPVPESKARLVAYMEILPAFEKEVKEGLTVMEAESNKESDCEQFVVNTRNDSPFSIVIYEAYKDDEAFQSHKTSPHAKKFFELVKGKIINDKIEAVKLTGLNSSK